MSFAAVVIEHEFEPGRWLACRRADNGWTTVEIDCPTREAAEAECRRLQRGYDYATANVKPTVPGEMRQIPLGFYTDEDAA